METIARVINFEKNNEFKINFNAQVLNEVAESYTEQAEFNNSVEIIVEKNISD